MPWAGGRQEGFQVVLRANQGRTRSYMKRFNNRFVCSEYLQYMFWQTAKRFKRSSRHMRMPWDHRSTINLLPSLYHIIPHPQHKTASSPPSPFSSYDPSHLHLPLTLFSPNTAHKTHAHETYTLPPQSLPPAHRRHVASPVVTPFPS